MDTSVPALAYMAAIVDGEGSIELKLQSNKVSVDLLLHVFNSDRPLMDWMREKFGGSVYEIHRKARAEKPQWQPVYNWNLRGQYARDLLVSLHPFMIIKKAQAELAIEYWDNRQVTPRTGEKVGGGRGRNRPSDEVIAMRLSYKERMHALNRKNRGPVLP